MKKILYLLLALLTLVTIAPYTVKAEESKEIIKIDIVVVEPVEGENPVMKGTVKYSTATETIEYKDIGIIWYSNFTGEYLTEQDVFEADNAYSPEIEDETPYTTDVESKGYTFSDDIGIYINNKSTDQAGHFYIGAVKEISILFENVVVGKPVKDAKMVYLVKDASGKEYRFVLGNIEWLEYHDEGSIPVDKDDTFKKGVSYLTGMQDVVYEEGKEEVLMSFQNKYDINTIRNFNGKPLTTAARLLVTATEEENPNTLDNVSASIILSILSLTGLITTTLILRRKVRAN